MKKLCLSFLMLALTAILPAYMHAQNVEFEDEFETGTTNWVLTGNWGLSTNAFTGIYGLTESPLGNYFDMETSTATMANGVDLSLATDAYIEFAATYNIEYSFDYLYIEASYNNGASWLNVTSFTGDSLWWRYSFSIGGFVGHSNVKVRLRFVSDQALNYNGFSIDNFKIVSYTEDVTPPMILHAGPAFYEGSLDTFFVQTEIVDVSGVANASLHYWKDAIYQGVITGLNYSGDDWIFAIPPQPAGAWIDYYLIAADSALIPNIDTTALFKYIAGNTIKYDNGQVDFVQNVGFSSLYFSAAVKIDLNGLTNVVSGLIRTYTDPFIVNGPITFHIWRDNNGIPGTDLVAPFLFTPEANVSSPHKMSRIDLRPYADSLNGLTGSVFVGFTSTTQHYTPVTTPGIGDHTYIYDGWGWYLSYSDFHFRAVTSAITGAPNADFSYNAGNDPAVAFSDSSTGSPINWTWNFDDGTILTQVQNPSYIFQQNGTYHVCLTVDNGITSDTHCEYVEITNCVAPVAGYSFISDYSPEILFQDTSSGYPTTWLWDFDDNGNTWNYLNPMYTFTHNDTFNVCLYISNFYGADTICQTIIIDDYTAPQAQFAYSTTNSPYIQFYDMTSSQIINSPDSWSWNFGDGSAVDLTQNPMHIFPDNGLYEVCLTATNSLGSTTYCNQVYINSFVAPTADFSWNSTLVPTFDFLDESSDSIQNLATYWQWDFGDGGSDNVQNPHHIYAQNGDYQVCLIAGNVYGTDTICKIVTVNCYAVPTAHFIYTILFEPLILFTDNSYGVPTSWHWNFEELNQQSINQNPGYTYTTNGLFSVCLKVSNYLGSDSICHDVLIDYYTAPASNFSWEQTGDGEISFTDLSTMNPTSWSWTFGDAAWVSSFTNPVYQYIAAGTYEVCLVASNGIGTGTTACKSVIVQHSAIDEVNSSRLSIYPNPAVDYCTLLAAPDLLMGGALRVLNLEGKEVAVKYETNAEGILIYLDKLPAGLYEVILESGNEISHSKLIKLNE